MYSEKILNIFANLECYGAVKRPSAQGIYKNEKTGDVICLTIKLENGKIVDARFKTFGCVATIVASEIVCEMILYKYIVDIKKITASDILAQVGALPEDKHAACQNALMALKELITNFEKKEAKRLKQALKEQNLNSASF